MVTPAVELLQVSGLGSVTRGILTVCSFLDDAGAGTWNLRMVGAVTAISLGGLRIAFGNKLGVKWDYLLHAIVSSAGSLACLYLDLFAIESLTGVPEPLRSLQCGGPLTSLHRILPAITMGYAIFDFMEGITYGIDFALHGLVTLALMAYFCEINAPQIIVPYLVMEVSTIFLNLVKAEFLSIPLMAANQAAFALTFFVFRLVVSPYVWYRFVTAAWQHSQTPTYQGCFSPMFLPCCICGGMFFHILNAYWFQKIVKKIRRKLAGLEQVNTNNELGEKDEQCNSNHGKMKDKTS